MSLKPKPWRVKLPGGKSRTFERQADAQEFARDHPGAKVVKNQQLARARMARKPWRVVVDGKTRTFADKAEAQQYADEHGSRVQLNGLIVGTPSFTEHVAISRDGTRHRLRMAPGVMAEVDARSGKRCEVRLPGCTDAAGYTRHHRWRTGQGGPDLASNLVGACTSCHTTLHGSPRHRLPDPEGVGFGYLVGLLLRPGDPAHLVPWVRPDGLEDSLLMGLASESSGD